LDRFNHPSSTILSTFPRTLIKTSYYYIRSKSLIALYSTQQEHPQVSSSGYEPYAFTSSPAQTIEYNYKIQRSLLPPASSTNQDKGNQPLRIFSFGSEFNRCLIAPLKCVHLKKTKSNVISAETKQTLLPKKTICNNQMSS